jgi:DHA1 family multidrug resistance protein-like MFS transporter
MIWGPFSELYGRTTPLFIGYALFTIFNIPVAVAQDTETVMLGRFFQGINSCAPLAVTAGALADIWGPVERGLAVMVFSVCCFIGPLLSPVVGGFIVMDDRLGWRWVEWSRDYLYV